MASEDKNELDQDQDPSRREGDEGAAETNDAEAAAATVPEPMPAAERKQLSAGQRLAAAKAAKAAKKAAAREQARAEQEAAERAANPEPEPVEDEVAQVAEAATNWVQDHQKTIISVLVGAAALSAVILLVQHFQTSVDQEAGGALEAALTAARADIGEPVEGARTVPGALRFDDEAAREAEAANRYDAIIRDHGDSLAGAWARVARGRIKLSEGEFAAAKELFDAALANAGGSVTLRAAALQGAGFACEGADDWDGANERYARLADLGGAHESVAAYHQARVLVQKGEREQAIERLQALIEALRGEGAPELPFVQDQAELALMTLDSSLVQRSAAPAGLDSLPPELLQQLLQQQQGAQ